MVIDCHACVDGLTSAGATCTVCGGNGEIDLLDHAFRRIKLGPMKNLTGEVWSSMLTSLASIEAKVDLQDIEIADIKNKVNDIKEKVDEIKEVVDEL